MRYDMVNPDVSLKSEVGISREARMPTIFLCAKQSSNISWFARFKVSRKQESKKEINAASNMAIKISNKQ